MLDTHLVRNGHIYIYIYTGSLNTQQVYFVVVQSVISIFQECFTLFGSIRFMVALY